MRAAGVLKFGTALQAFNSGTCLPQGVQGTIGRKCLITKWTWVQACPAKQALMKLIGCQPGYAMLHYTGSSLLLWEECK